MNSTFKINELQYYLKYHQPVDTSGLLSFYRKFDGSLSYNTLRWRIHELKKLQVIYSPKRGYYALKDKTAFTHDSTLEMDHIVRTIQTSLPESKFSIYSTDWLTDYSDHTYPCHNIMIDVEACSLTSAFNQIKQSHENVFLSPEESIYEHYISPKSNNIILNKLYVDAPVNHVDSFYYTPKLEKLLVDLILNDPLILMISKPEIKTIVSNLQKAYHINYSTLNRYSKKRYLGERITKYGLLQA
ncbi:DUF6577 family protein [Marinilactibacillus sp. XAAS-LB27]|uniref:DUF6577 family protein n=1 Tax=Marinilactibacillus sp. XAAS-LB27 TaxID=3114538 RepID=UPI002E174805|nr:DUF6577 family protein [Marinilactibacillus sp. XAAS-LB27]